MRCLVLHNRKPQYAGGKASGFHSCMRQWEGEAARSQVNSQRSQEQACSIHTLKQSWACDSSSTHGCGFCHAREISRGSRLPLVNISESSLLITELCEIAHAKALQVECCPGPTMPVAQGVPCTPPFPPIQYREGMAMHWLLALPSAVVRGLAALPVQLQQNNSHVF